MIVVVGAGSMGQALLAGWLAAGIPAAELAIIEADPAQAKAVSEKYQVASLGAADLAAADEVVLCVKPQHIGPVVREIRDYLAKRALVVSIAAGVACASIAELLAPGQPLVRVMPNTPALVGQGMAGVAPSLTATEAHVTRAVELLSAVGRAEVVAEEQLDAVTALSGSGPAYVFYLAEAMIDAGIQQGLSREVATALVNQTLVGASALLAASDDPAAVLRERVTSPGGTTAAAVAVLDDRSVRDAVVAAVTAAAERSAELGKR